MKKIISMLSVAMIATATFAQSEKDLYKEQAELNKLKREAIDKKATKSAKKQAKTYKKEGWNVMAGDLDMERQISKVQEYKGTLTRDENGNTITRYIIQSGRNTAGSYNSAYNNAQHQAQAAIATMIRTQLVSAIESKLDNAQESSISAVTVEKFHQRTKAIVDETLTNTASLLTIYRTLPNNNFEVMVQIAYDRLELAARIKRNLQRELEKEGDTLLPIVDDIICNKVQ